MIYEIIIIAAILGIFVIIARRMPNIRGEKISNNFPNQPKDQKNIPNNLPDQAEFYFNRKDFARAEEIYIKLASINPEDYKIYNRLGIIYLEQKNFSDAKDAFNATIKLGGPKASRYYNLALAYLGLQEYRNALEAIEKAVELEKNNQKYLDLHRDIKNRLKKFKPRKK